MPARVDISGQRFGRLVATTFVGVVKKRSRWLCNCDCGNTLMTELASLRNGSTQSCGCRRRDLTIKRLTTHGKTDSDEHNIWCGIATRCYNERHHRYPLYGGRGIVMCDRWRESFENFFADMGPRPSKQHSVDRINNDGPYSPENCRWATQGEQCNNWRKTIRTEIRGQLLTLREIADGYGVDYKKLSSRYHRGRRGDALLSE